MRFFGQKMTLCLLLLLTLITNACQSGSNKEASALKEQQVILKITSPAENAPKRILKVETFKTASCFYDRNLTTSHADYQGVLLYVENLTNTDINEQRSLSANKPMTIKASLSKIFSADKSDICYFQPVSFTPKPFKSYELYLSSFCEMIIYETHLLNKETIDVRLINIDENKDC